MYSLCAVTNVFMFTVSQYSEGGFSPNTATLYDLFCQTTKLENILVTSYCAYLILARNKRKPKVCVCVYDVKKKYIVSHGQTPFPLCVQCQPGLYSEFLHGLGSVERISVQIQKRNILRKHQQIFKVLLSSGSALGPMWGTSGRCLP